MNTIINRHTFHLSFAAILIASAPFTALVATAQESIETISQPSHVKIVWNLKDSDAESTAVSKKETKPAWTKACTNLGKSLSVGKGPWGFGVFQSYSCWIDDEKITTTETPASAWTFNYTESKDAVLFTIMDESGVKQGERSIAASPHSVYFFQDLEFADLVALTTMDSLPYFGYLPKGSLSSGKPIRGRAPYLAPKTKRRFGAVSPPKELTAYGLEKSRTNNVFMPDVKGTLNQSSKKGTSVTWKADPSVIQANESEGLWIHVNDGRNSMKAAIEPVLTKAQEELNRLHDEGLFSSALGGFKKGLLSTAASGYLGLRYGSQILQGDPLLKSTHFYGLLSEIRGGPLEGIRLYYDHLFERHADQNGFDTSIFWNRFIVGKSFGLDLKRFIDRIDITPKIGVWNFNATLPAEYNSDSEVIDVGRFKLSNALSASLELGLEWSSSWYTIRPWYSLDAAGFLSVVKSASVTSNRFGFDTYWTAGPTFKLSKTNFKTAWLAFIIYEAITLADAKQSDVAEEETKINGVTVQSAYAGGGIAVSW